jgi:hypothetical protein
MSLAQYSQDSRQVPAIPALAPITNTLSPFAEPLIRTASPPASCWCRTAG